MTKDQLEYLMENRDRLGLAMLRHCIILAKTKYGWVPGQMLPQGRDPEMVVHEVMGKYFDGKRTLVEGESIEAQLKQGVRSWLSSIYARMDSHALPLEEAEEVPSAASGPAADAEHQLDYTALIAMIFEVPLVKSSEELQLLLMAIQDGAEDIKAQSDATGLSADRIYELRKKLRPIVSKVLDEYNKEGEPV